MKRATVIIGTNFGDEGKGLLTDYHAARDDNAIVVRFNGGAQAGHTVVTPQDRRHVFHHFGSGTLAGAPTFLSRHFIVNPLLWAKEQDELEQLAGAAPRLLIDPRAMLTTPFDMLINQQVERERGAARHGSCGIGINETVERCATDFATRVADARRPKALREKLVDLRRAYLPQRLGALKLTLDPQFEQLAADDRLIDAFVATAGQMLASSECAGSDALNAFNHVIFEGAQGLLLDEHHRYFPHVTRSRTGLANVLAIAGEAGLRHLAVTYMTRAYMTRHGAGPFESENATLRFADATNVPNEFQGTLRFGLLDLPLLAESIARDLASPGAEAFDIEAGIAVTCLDQVGSQVAWVERDERGGAASEGAASGGGASEGGVSGGGGGGAARQRKQGDPRALIAAIEQACALPVTHLSYGPTRAHVAPGPAVRAITPTIAGQR